ncbi:aminotransferase class V-fold PLP-dependent enzyme [Candidatus Xianfuyuplasma coldseepsis]|uniref:Cysteine desulfurase n=1 Tax=Candidatus Xianfuyuplasma coldseepsis TaxID=2782163 RepID=A0A7L7KPG8_9MOLU|nr:SufS family cysteine desulfurase [Xianfuyuplasma coldseepsis]QMS84445.1 SufS family cysteine desulfurase [Xianfuyuplasma coldseepsis]
MNAHDLRNDFPVLSDPKLIYLDSAASSLKPQVVMDAMDEYYANYGVNVHRGVYNLSYVATTKYEEARQQVASFINASFHEIVFTRGASSALNLIASSYGLNNLGPDDEIIVSELEHHSHVLPWQNVSRITGAKLIYVPLNEEGRITTENVKKVLSTNTKIVALTYVSNVMGYITPIKEIIHLAHEVGAVVSVDAAQATPHMTVDVQELDCDFLAFSGHKMLGPTGVGVLYGKRHLLDAMPPIEFGGDMNDNVNKYDASWKEVPYKFETGTPPIAEVIGLGKAISYLQAIGLDNIHHHEQELHDYVVSKMEAIDGVEIYNKTAETGVISFNLSGVHPHDAVTFFDQENICMRAGHHCAQLVIKWLEVAATLRVSFYIYNTKDDADRFIEVLHQARDFFTEMGF